MPNSGLSLTGGWGDTVAGATDSGPHLSVARYGEGLGLVLCSVAAMTRLLLQRLGCCWACSLRGHKLGRGRGAGRGLGHQSVEWE